MKKGTHQGVGVCVSYVDHVNIFGFQLTTGNQSSSSSHFITCFDIFFLVKYAEYAGKIFGF